MKKDKRNFLIAICLLALFALWTILVKCIDVQIIGPHSSAVGFATLNGFFHRLTGVNMALYTITDWLSVIPIGFVIFFAILGLLQLIRRKSLLKVDTDILLLGIYYIIVMAAYLFFQSIVINYRPVLIGGNLEASYPSSTTLLVLSVMPTAILQLRKRIKNTMLVKVLSCVIAGFTVFMAVSRLISGVHWLTDIIGGILFSSGLVMLYITACSHINPDENHI